ncbi:MAG: hypothetical protein M1830_009639 [Pleopsidium flavum]|nr:MAG: hypothetical protein M1830_009639 [Pleopsidium flavum]
MGIMYDQIYSQLFVTPPYPMKQITGQTIIVTGANCGLGLEAARHFVRLHAEKVILAVRNLEKGEAAKQSIETCEKRVDVVEVWQLDLASYESVKQFASRAEGLNRLDVVVENAGIATKKFSMMEDNESSITTNVISTFLLALLILPKLRDTAVKFDVLPRLVIVASFTHYLTQFPEGKTDNIFNTLNSKETANMDFFPLDTMSKLLEIFVVRELGDLMRESSKEGRVIINCLNPG